MWDADGATAEAAAHQARPAGLSPAAATAGRCRTAGHRNDLRQFHRLRTIARLRSGTRFALSRPDRDIRHAAGCGGSGDRSRSGRCRGGEPPGAHPRRSRAAHPPHHHHPPRPADRICVSLYRGDKYRFFTRLVRDLDGSYLERRVLDLRMQRDTRDRETTRNEGVEEDNAYDRIANTKTFTPPLYAGTGSHATRTQRARSRRRARCRAGSDASSSSGRIPTRPWSTRTKR